MTYVYRGGGGVLTSETELSPALNVKTTQSSMAPKTVVGEKEPRKLTEMLQGSSWLGELQRRTREAEVL